MQHYYHSIQGWFGYETLYRDMVKRFPTESHFVEVGCWRGRSTSFLAVEIINSGKKIKLDCVDTWKGSFDEDIHQKDSSVINDTLYDEFLKNMEPVKNIINPIRMTSEDASKLYDNDSLDFVLLDAGHSYEDILSDIKYWLPKVKTGGIIAGDDYSQKWEGVMKAVDELFPNCEKNIHRGYWWYEK